ncbi:pseudouridine synthase [Patescibacteria group bacterium]
MSLPSERIRLNKFLVQAGVAASRRQAEELISNSKVKIVGAQDSVPNNQLMGYRVDPTQDKVYVHDKLIVWRPQKKVYLMMNKPRGYVCTRQDKFAQKTVFDLLPAKYKKTGLFTVGRLDKESEGLLLLTNDGDWANKLMHPRYGKEKEYLVWVKGEISPEKFGRLTTGLTIDGKKYQMKRIETLGTGTSSKTKKYQVILAEGRKRQIRVMFEKIGGNVIRLQRIRVGEQQLGDLPSGKVKEINI